MVDGALAARDRPVGGSGAGVEAHCTVAPASHGLADYRRLAALTVESAPAQSAAWVEAWTVNAGGDPLIAMLSLDGRPALALALDVVGSGPFRIATFMGGRHANGNFPLLAPRDGGTVTPAHLGALFTAIGTARPDIDLIRLERLAETHGAARNPLLQLAHRVSPNLALAVDLDGGFDAVLARTSGKRKRKKHRSQTRKFEAAGGYRRLVARTPDEVDRLFGAFLAMKEQRFRKMGIANVFADAGVRAFFTTLFKDSLAEATPRFFLHGLEVGGRLRAVTGSSLAGGRMICEFGAIAEDDMAFASPGDFLFFENIREAAEAGLALYDFSVGDEPYKRLWCDTEITQFDVLVPLSAKGRAYAGLLGATSSLKAWIKANPTAWRLVKRLRRQSRGAAESGADD